MPNEKPILLKPEMVRAILAGKKTQTRRVVKHIPLLGDPLRWCAAAQRQEPGWVSIVGDYRRFCPYGAPGSGLWVRETFSLCGHGEKAYVVFKDGGQKYKDGGAYFHGLSKYSDGAFDGCKWKPSIHMPRWACRLVLEIADVRVERLQDITWADAVEEGVAYDNNPNRIHSHWEHDQGNPVYQFKELWNSIHSKDGCDWDKNPWLWVLTFNRVGS